MKNVVHLVGRFAAGLAIASALALGGCGNYQERLATFTNNVVATNKAIGEISQSLAKNCDSLEATATSLAGLAGVLNVNQKAQAGLAAANAALTAFCQAPPADIPSAVAAVAAQVAAAKKAYDAALKNGKS